MTRVSDASASMSENCLAAGVRLADFEIRGIIGEGGFGIVYLAFDHLLQRAVAIKEYMPGAIARRAQDRRVEVRKSRDQEVFDTGLKSFINEARLLAQFDHYALVKVHQFWEENGTAYMAMRLYEGRTLKNVIATDPGIITEQWLKGMLKPILEALEALYAVNVLHRDISPDNIMIQNSGAAVLLDFGAARKILAEQAHALTVILKPGYAPIEQYVDDADDAAMQQGPWTDIYSLSAVIYLAITKLAPPTSVTRTVKDTLRSLQDGAHPGYSREFLSAIDQGLAVKPEDRPQSIAAFRSLFVSTAQEAMAEHQQEWQDDVLSVAGTGQSAKASNVLAPKWRPPLPAAVALALICALGAGGYLWIARGASAPVATQVAKAVVDAAPLATTQAEAARTEPAPQPEPVLQSEPKPEPVLQPEPQPEPAAQLAPAAEPVGRVALRIKPWALVSVDGVAKGASPPLKTLTLPEGKHQVKLSNPSFPDRIVEIEVRHDKAGKLEHNFSSVKN